jgi:thymidylate synthase (FAD)
MKLINQNVEEWHCGYTLPEIWSHIAKCTRVCYQSEPRNNCETDEEFVKRVILRNHSFDEIAKSRELQLKLHLSVLEHGTVYLDIPREEDTIIYSAYFSYNHYSERAYGYGLKSYVTTNMRVLVEQGLTNYFKYICAPTRYHSLRTTFNIITDIGVARELARHRTHSISEESTRYCNYSKDKFNNELTFIKPCCLNDEKLKLYGDYHTVIRDKSPESIFIANLNNVEKDYLDLIKLGWTPQQARQILPLSTKVQTIHTAFESDWAEFISLRADACSGSVHPNMKVIANKIMVLMAKKDATL